MADEPGIIARPDDEERRDAASDQQPEHPDEIDGVLIWSSMDLPGMDGADGSE